MESTEQRGIAVATFNRCWDLIEGQRTPENDRELLMLAFTSRYHWLQVGGAREFAIADWLVSRAFATTGHGALAIEWAEAAQAQDREEFPAWMKASMFEGLARAYKVAGNEHQMRYYLDQAIAALALEPNPHEVDIIRTQIEEL